MPPSRAEGTEAPIEKGSGSQGDIKIGAPQGASGANVEGITQSAADASLKVRESLPAELNATC